MKKHISNILLVLLVLNIVLFGAKLISPYSFYSDKYNPDVFLPVLMIVSSLIIIVFAMLDRKNLQLSGKLMCGIISPLLLIVSAVLYNYHSGYKFTYHEFTCDTNDDVVLVIKEDDRFIGKFLSFYTKENDQIIKKINCHFVNRDGDSPFDDSKTKITWIDDKSFTFEFPCQEGVYNKYLISTDGSHSVVEDEQN